jgi:hypothetical protein
MEYSEIKMNIKAQKNEAYTAALDYVSKQIISGEMTTEEGAKYLVDNGYDLEVEMVK